MTDNPLLRRDLTIPFDAVRPEHLAPAVDALVADVERAEQAIVDAPSPRTWANTMEAFDALGEHMDVATSVMSHLESVATTSAYREAFNAIQPKLSEIGTRLALSERLARAVREYSETDEAKALPPARRRFLERTMAGFRRAGAYAEPKVKERLAAIDVELTDVTLKFTQNVLDSTSRFELVIEDEARLKGLPPSAVAAAKQAAEAKGASGYRFTLQAPSYIAVLTYMDDRATREAVYRGYLTRATAGEHDNRPLLTTILRLRREKATLLGYATFADLILEDRMAKTPGAARSFVTKLRDRGAPFAARENAELEAFARSRGAPTPLEAWDVPYWAEKLRRARFDVDDEELRPYFAVDRVLAGLFEIARRLYGVRVTPWLDAPTWSPAVRAYTMGDESGARLGRFYVDTFPREDKRDGAWMSGMIASSSRSGGAKEHVGVFCANVTPPIGDAPALLTHHEVVTLFHEFGHLLHHLLSRTELRLAAGTNVAWDFVELPSQIFENWAWERAALDLFAQHHETGEKLPDALLDRMRRARAFRAGNATMRQLGFAELDLALHVDHDPTSATADDVIAMARKIAQDHAPTRLPEDYAMVAAFGHLFSSPVAYAAGYYSYKWAEVLDADAFGRFLGAGIFDPDTGAAFRDRVLARGDSEDPMRLFVDFMGREPDLAALLERSGLTEQSASP